MNATVLPHGFREQKLGVKERSDEELLEEIRSRYRYATDQWKEIRDEGDKDMRCIAGETWAALDPAGLKERQDNARPAISNDELGQYVNQGINDVRQNKRAIKIGPEGDGANDQTAELRQNRIRQIEARSNALEDAYITMYENALQRSYGYLRIVPKLSRASYKGLPNQQPDPSWFNQELYICPVPNPNMVTPDPDNLMVDGSDWKYLFYGERWKKKDFQRRWPDAQIQSFDADLAHSAPQWISADGEDILVAEYWEAKTARRRLLLYGRQDNPQVAWADDLKTAPPKDAILRDEWLEIPEVCQYITNGVEIIETKPWRGSSIPFVPCYGKILYVPDGGATKRRLLSLIRLARDPQMLYNYIQTCKAEAIGGVPRATWVGYKGQFRGVEAKWQEANRKPVAYLEAQPITEATGANILPLPQRQVWDPPIQNLEIAGESARRAIQAAIGISPLPTNAQRRNDKSGVALEKIEESAQRGSFHFVDHFNAAIRRTGTILDELLPHYEDTVRDVTVRKPDDSTELVTINEPNSPNTMTQGRHDVTISVGPAFATEREEASAFADMLIGSPLMSLFPPPLALKIISLAVKLKAVGPLGDEIAKALDPEQGGEQQGPTPEQVAQMQAQMQELQQKLQQAVQAIETEQAKQQATLEKAKIDADAQVVIAQLREKTAVAIARLQHMVKPSQEADAEAIQNDLQREFDALMAERQRQHEIELARLKAEFAAQQAERQHEQTIDQEVVRADLQPKPERPQATT